MVHIRERFVRALPWRNIHAGQRIAFRRRSQPDNGDYGAGYHCTGLADAAQPGATSAFGASASVILLPGVLGSPGLTIRTGRLATSTIDGPNSASVVDLPLRGLVTAAAVTSSATRAPEAGQANATAAIVDTTLPVLAGVTGGISAARVIRSRCSTGTRATGSAELAGLDLGRLGRIPVSTPPNFELGIPDVVRVLVNEQVRHADGSLTVNALHITLLDSQTTGALGRGDIVLASVTCAATTPASSVAPPTSRPSASAPSQANQVSLVPHGAPQTGDGSLATTAEN